MNDKLHQVIGIDLGTTYSAVAVYNTYTEQAEIIVDSTNDKATTPSVISLHKTLQKAMVGWDAKRNLVVDPENTIIEIKREMGELFSSETLEKYNATGTWAEKTPVKAHFAGQWLSPQEISAFTLMKMKEIAEQKIGGEVRDAVVTVPAYFTEQQKQATKEAALLAGLYPRQLIPEPTAAAICYGVDQYEAERRVYLVYDLGGGTFDVSIITVQEDNIQVIATSGDPRLGGGDFDDAITKWAVQKLKTDYNLNADTVAQARIKASAENAKILLSTHTSTTINLAELFPQQPPVLELERKTFEGLIESLLKRSILHVDVALESAAKKGVQRDDVDAILLVGGSSKIPVIKDQLLDYFGKDDSFVRSELNPDEVVARGAAILANRFKPSPPPFDISKEIDNTALLNVDAEDNLNVQLITEHSLGIAVAQGNIHNIFSKIIDQGSPIPIEKTESGYSAQPGASRVEVRVYQGENEFCYDNTLIGTLNIDNLQPRQDNYHQFQVTFKLDENGLLSMVVFHINEKVQYKAKFEQETGVKGGNAALAPLRNKLLNLFASHDAIKAVTTQSVPRPPQTSPEEAADFTPPPPTATTGEPVPPTPVQPETPPPESSPAKLKSEPAVSGILEPTADIPAEFKSIARRARKKLIKTQNPDLLKAFNAFASALNAGVSGDDLEELGDKLGDVYHDTPDGPTIIEPTVEVPAQFKSIIRRAHKQLIEEMSPDLLNAFNVFISALNGGMSEEKLEELGDTLDDLYHDARS